MIENWREVWNKRTNGNTDLQFPFGVVQVGVYLYIQLKMLVFVSVVNSIQ